MEYTLRDRKRMEGGVKRFRQPSVPQQKLKTNGVVTMGTFGHTSGFAEVVRLVKIAMTKQTPGLFDLLCNESIKCQKAVIKYGIL